MTDQKQYRPTALAETIGLLGGPHFPRCESPSLRLEKFVRIGNAMKGEEVMGVAACQRNYGRPIPPVLPRGAEQFSARLGWRMIINQAGGILQNAGICLHPHFGTPFVPGSAVKGVTRHAAWCEWEEESDPQRKLSIARDIARVFGFPTGDKDKDGLDAFLERIGQEERAGSVAFLAAVPDGKAELVPDVVTCHHMKYYSGDRHMPYAFDNEEPNPQMFPAVGVARDERFIFTLAPTSRLKTGDLALAKRWLLQAITVNGIGAKTAAGYGWFSYDEAEDRTWRVKREEMAAKGAAEAARKKRVQECRARIAEVAALPDASLPPYKAELAKIGNEAADGFGMLWTQADQEALQGVLRRMPQLSEGEKLRADWQALLEAGKLKSIFKKDIAGFARMSDAKKKAVIELLREPDGVGHDVWQEIRQGQKGDIANGVNEVRNYCKNTLNLGKMP